MRAALQLIGWVAALALGALLGLPAGELPALVEVAWGPWQWQGSPWLVATLAVIAWIVLYLLTRFVLALTHVPEGWSRWRSKRGERQRERQLRQAWEALKQGRHSRAVSLCSNIANTMARSVAGTDGGRAGLGPGRRPAEPGILAPEVAASPLIVLTAMVGFAAARRLGDRQQAGRFFAALLAGLGPSGILDAMTPPSSGAAVGSGAGEDGDIDGMVLDALQRWVEAEPDDTEVRLALAAGRLRRGERAGAAQWLGSDPGAEVTPAWVALAAEVAVPVLAGARTRAELEEHWSRLDAAVTDRAPVVRTYVQALLRLGLAPTEPLADETQALLLAQLKHRWSPELAVLYAQVPSPAPLEQLARIEHWLSERPASAPLLRAAGEVSVRAQLWGKARAYLRASAQITPLPATLFELAKLEESLGQSEEAARWMERGVARYREAEVGRSSAGAAEQVPIPRHGAGTPGNPAQAAVESAGTNSPDQRARSR